MKTRLAGITVSSSEVDVVILDHTADSLTLINAQSLKLQSGKRPPAYKVFADQLVELLKQEKVECVCIKGSALSRGGMTNAHLDGAELRGVVQSAAAGICDVRVMLKATASRTFGDRKVDEYLKDDAFWARHKLSALKKGLREAAFSAISVFPITT